MLLLAPICAIAQTAGLPIILPEAVFANLGRVTGGTTQQRIMDRGSIIRIKLADDQDRIPPDTDVLLFRQGLRLRSAERTLGVLAVPVGRGRTLQRLTENQEIADPNEPGVAWVRIQSVRQEVSRGDSLMTASEAQRWGATSCDEPTRKDPPPANPNTSSNPANPGDARVIGLVSSDVLADPLSASLDLVVISGGCQTGLKTGQAVSLWRPPVTTFGRKLDQPVDGRDNNSASVIDDNPGIARTQIPGHRIGSGVIVAAYAEAALVRIRVATQPVQVEDQVRPMLLRNQP
ncbi:MAG: hypothetical protein ACKN9C_01310 [Fluviibacter sp.]